VRNHHDFGDVRIMLSPQPKPIMNSSLRLADWANAGFRKYS
jgi:hypothetical protein